LERRSWIEALAVKLIVCGDNHSRQSLSMSLQLNNSWRFRKYTAVQVGKLCKVSQRDLDGMKSTMLYLNPTADFLHRQTKVASPSVRECHTKLTFPLHSSDLSEPSGSRTEHRRGRYLSETSFGGQGFESSQAAIFVDSQ
jgi:hypothetical protein